MSSAFNLLVCATISGMALSPMCGMTGSSQLRCGSRRVHHSQSLVPLTHQPSPGKHWKHEDASEMMFDNLVAKNNIDLPENDAQFIKALIAGDPSVCSYAFQGCYAFRVFHTTFPGTATHRRNRSCLKSLQTSATASTLISQSLLHFHITHL